MTSARPNIYSLTRQALTKAMTAAQVTDNPAARAHHMFHALYAGPAPGLEELDVSRRIKPRLAELFDFTLPVAVETREASPTDGSEKLMVRCGPDGALVETVLVPERGRLTQCISTQAGCRQACHFCSTGRMGFRRNLSTEEIVGQVVMARLMGHPVSNVVLMGMGEPLDNLENVMPALEILTCEQGLRLSPNKVTLSTVGLLPQLDFFLENSRASCALSLHSPFHEERSRLIPTNHRHPLEAIVQTLRRHGELSGRSYMIQYLLVNDFNDTPAHARKLHELFQGIDIKINIIPMNEHEGSPFLRPDVNRIFQFQQSLKELGLVATVRLSKGRDIQAACGQLVARKQRS